jgi:Mrp family chromosome partitioning ATPase
MSKIQTALERAKTGRRSPIGTAQQNQDTATISSTGQFIAQHPRNIALSRVPRIHLDTDVFAASRLLVHDSNERHPAQGAYRMLRTRLMKNMRSNNWRVLGVTSLGQNEGKTYTSINLAISIAAEIEQEAILVDLDLQRPSVCGYLGADAADFVSLRDYLQNEQMDLSELLVCPNIERLACILTHDPLERSSDLLASPRGALLFSELRERISEKTVIIVDLPPLLAADDALAVAPLLDALLLVVAEGETERSELGEARPILDEFNLIGTVLNKSKEKESKRANYY